MRLVIIESPYAGDIERNVDYARRAMADQLLQGCAPLASHLLYTQPGVLDDSIPKERARGIAAGIYWSEKAHYAVFYVDWGWSGGMIDARDHYDAIGLPYETREIGR